MLRKVCNYLAVLALSLVVTGNAVVANAAVVKRNGAKTVKVENDKNFHFYQEFLRGGGAHSYSIKVKAGEEVKVSIKATRGVSLKIQAPSGQTTTTKSEKQFEVKLSAEGEYTINLESGNVSQYTLEVLSK
jgi:hypothetical protein